MKSRTYGSVIVDPDVAVVAVPLLGRLPIFRHIVGKR
jgi:hypothetical protein